MEQRPNNPEGQSVEKGMEAQRRADTVPEKYAHIKGWGIDADPKNDPTYPIKKRNNAEHQGYTWERPAQQALNVEVHYSIERPNVTAVFGTAAPPKGLSGELRRMAFRKSENDYSHWLPLMLADRVDMMEGIVEDMAHGRIPNLYQERGLAVDWQHDRQALAAKVVLGVGIAAAALMWLGRERQRSESGGSHTSALIRRYNASSTL